MAYSYSAIKEFKNCPRKYYETRILKKWQQEETDAMRYGTDVHEALELHIKEGKPLGPHSRFQEIANALSKLNGEKLTELEMGLDESLNPCEFLGEHTFIRGIADLVIIDWDKKTASVFDYKTGSAKYPDTDQLELMALMLFRYYPEIERVKGGLLFILHDKVVPATFDKADAREKWIKWAAQIEKIEQCKDTGVFNENPSGLCGWCPCKTCPHQRERK